MAPSPLPRAAHPTAPGRPVWVRLAALVAVPVLGLVGVLTPRVLAAHDAAASARHVPADVRSLQQLIDLRSAVTAEQIYTEAEARVVEYGLTLTIVKELVGYDIAARLTAARAGTDIALAAVDGGVDSTLARITRDAMAQARAAADRGVVDPDALHAELTDVRRSVATSVDEHLRRLLVHIGLDVGRARELDALREASRLGRAGNEVTNELADVFIGPSEQKVSARSLLIGAAAVYRDASAELRHVSPAWATRVAALEAGEPRAAFFDTVDLLSDLSAEPPSDLGDMVLVYAAGDEFNVALQAVVRQATDEATGWATGRAAAAQRELESLMALAAAVIGGTAALAAVGARSLSRRLGQLARSAASLSDGELLDGDERPIDGPREVALAWRALRDARANLRNVERQAAALASGALDDVSLLVPAPGRLGGAIHASVARLSDAWRERTELQHRLHHQATHDTLTGLVNRARLTEELRSRLDGDAPVAAVFIDLDGFKQANDDYGHLLGDRVLQHVARLLERTVGAHDVVARLGGDEFVVVTSPPDADDARALGQRLVDAVRSLSIVEGRTVRLGASVGIGLVTRPGPGVDPAVLLDRADAAVYAAKRAGKGRLALELVGDAQATGISVLTPADASSHPS